MDLKMGSGQKRMWSVVNWLGSRSKDRFSVLKITVALLPLVRLNSTRDISNQRLR